MSFFASQWQRGAAALLSVNTLRFGAAQAPGRRMMHVAAASVAGVTGRRGAACGRAMVGLMRSAPSAPMCSSQLAGKVRYMGIMDSFQQALDTRKEDQISKKKSELFSAQITFISGLDEFQMKDHVTMVQVGGRRLLSVCLSGWLLLPVCVQLCCHSHLHGVRQQDIAAAMGLTGWKSKMRSSSSQKELLEKYPELLVSEHLSVSTAVVAHPVVVRAHIDRVARLPARGFGRSHLN